MKNLFYICLIFLMGCNCFSETPFEKIEKIKVGMTQQEMFQILGKIEWYNYENEEYEYRVHYQAENGDIRTFYITIKNDQIIETNSY